MTAPLEGTDVCATMVVRSRADCKTRIFTASGMLQETVDVEVKVGPLSVECGTRMTDHMQGDVESEVVHSEVRNVKESCKLVEKQKTTDSVGVQKMSCMKCTHPGGTTAKSGWADGSAVGLTVLMGDTSCVVPYMSGIEKGAKMVLSRPTSDSCELMLSGDVASVPGDRVATFNFMVEQSADTGSVMVQIHCDSMGNELCAVHSSPLIKGLVVGDSAEKAQKVAVSVKLAPVEKGTVTDGESQPDVVTVLVAGQSKNFGGVTQGNVNAPTPLDSQVGNTGHKTVQCSGGVVVTGFNSQGSVKVTNDSSCGRSVEDTAGMTRAMSSQSVVKKQVFAILIEQTCWVQEAPDAETEGSWCMCVVSGDVPMCMAVSTSVRAEVGGKAAAMGAGKSSYAVEKMSVTSVLIGIRLAASNFAQVTYGDSGTMGLKDSSSVSSPLGESEESACSAFVTCCYGSKAAVSMGWMDLMSVWSLDAASETFRGVEVRFPGTVFIILIMVMTVTGDVSVTATSDVWCPDKVSHVSNYLVGVTGCVSASKAMDATCMGVCAVVAVFVMMASDMSSVTMKVQVGSVAAADVEGKSEGTPMDGDPCCYASEGCEASGDVALWYTMCYLSMTGGDVHVADSSCAPELWQTDDSFARVVDGWSSGAADTQDPFKTKAPRHIADE